MLVFFELGSCWWETNHYISEHFIQMPEKKDQLKF